MNNNNQHQQQINILETKIQEIKDMISNWKQEIKQYENTLADLIQQATKLRNLENNKKNIK